MNKDTPATVDEYIARATPEQQAVLSDLRRAVKEAVPEAQELISYAIPLYKHKGRMLVAFSAAKKHCGFYPIGDDLIAAFGNELKPYQAKGTRATIRFPLDKPVPIDLVRRLVKARISESEGEAPGR